MAFSFLQDQWFLGLGVLFLLSSCAVLAVNKRQRDAVLERLHFHRRRASGASTPPRSFSPSKKTPISTPGNPDYSTTLPSSRREVLPELAKTLSATNSKILLKTKPSTDFILENQLPMTQSYAVDDGVPKYTPTGFSTAEIKAMGDFPAYDILTGTPLPQAYKEFDPATALPRPYRPFRWAYHQTMSFVKMESDWWLEVESSYIATIKKRQDLFREYGSALLDYMPGSELVCKELMEMCLQFYCARYPAYFSLSDDNKVFTNRLLGTTTEIKRFHPLHVLLNNVPEDFAIVLRNDEDGMYYFRAGVICSSLGWNVGTKIGLQLKDIHTPIPDYKEKMSFSMDRYFTKMPVNAPIQRGSWGLEVGTPLFMPPEHPHEKLREIQDPNLKIEDCNLRVDWQTLRRLPLSGGIVFNFTALFTPVTEFRDEPYIPALVNKILKEGKKNLMDYKGTWHVEHICIPAFEKYDREQVEKGLVKPEKEGEQSWTVGTLNEYPYFPGWEEKWHRQQGY
ncbi:hypothetical protein BDZ45DRAFT_702426 [Acephala macrosclerotiorum]|nr:hypothetical protein BDZ45DRAFT_702426 [Acephala macrosclerotiorum]